MISHEEAKAFWLHTWKMRPEYGDDINTKPYRERSIRLVDVFGPKIQDTRTFCELGIGSGRNVHYFHEKYPHWKYSANDINPTVHDIIARTFPDVLEYTDVAVADTLDYLKQIDPVDTLFTHGHLMHIPDGTIGEVCDLMVAKSRYIVMHEALGHLENSYVAEHKRFRFERDYADLFSELECALRLAELSTNTRLLYGMYLFRKVSA